MTTAAQLADPSGALCVATAHRFAEFALTSHPNGRPPAQFFELIDTMSRMAFGQIVSGIPGASSDDIDFLAQRTADLFAERYHALCELRSCLAPSEPQSPELS